MKNVSRFYIHCIKFPVDSHNTFITDYTRIFYNDNQVIRHRSHTAQATDLNDFRINIKP